MILPWLESIKIPDLSKVKARLALAKKTQPNARSYVSRCGYNTICTSYTQGIEIGRFSGSSLNRLQQQKRKNELKQLREKPAQIIEDVGETIYDREEYKQEINVIRKHIADREGNAQQVPKSFRKRSMPIHVLSKRSKGKVRDKATAFFRSCGTDKTFCTLTFINRVEDKQAVAILNKFFTQLREDHPGDFKYLWVAEKQNKNEKYPGNIHFHCIFNMYLDLQRYNSLWVLQQYNEGVEYPGLSRAQMLQHYDQGTIKKVLNPFHIRKVESDYALSYYLTKYITKNESDGFNCLAWHCSRAVSKLFTRTVVSYSCVQSAASKENSRKVRKTGEVRQGRQIKGNFYHLFFIENRPLFLLQMREIEQINLWILEGMIPDKIPEIDDIDISKFYNN